MTEAELLQQPRLLLFAEHPHQAVVLLQQKKSSLNFPERALKVSRMCPECVLSTTSSLVTNV